MIEQNAGAFLVVDDDPGVVRSVSRLLCRFATVYGAGSVVSAVEELRVKRRWAGFVLDLGLPDGSGLDFLAFARERHPTTPAILLTGSVEPSAINRAFTLHATYLCKPMPAESLRCFAEDAVRGDGQWRGHMESAVARVAEQRKLTNAEAEILKLAVCGMSPEAMLTIRGISENTYKTQVRGLLAKAGGGTLATLRDSVLRFLSQS